MELSKRQNEIVDAALHLTATRGIQHLTLKNLSEVIGISEPGLYRHFRSKSEIIAAMIGRFESGVSSEGSGVRGFRAIRGFVEGRLRQVESTPDLARVMFAEELFLDDPEFSAKLMMMMHKHRSELSRRFAEAVEDGEIPAGLPQDALFRIVMGPIRLLVKQWGMTGGAFDIWKKGQELLDTLESLFKRRNENHEA